MSTCDIMETHTNYVDIPSAEYDKICQAAALVPQLQAQIIELQRENDEFRQEIVRLNTEIRQLNTEIRRLNSTKQQSCVFA